MERVSKRIERACIPVCDRCIAWKTEWKGKGVLGKGKERAYLCATVALLGRLSGKAKVC